MPDTTQSNEREQVAEVFGLTGGELEDTPWVTTEALDTQHLALNVLLGEPPQRSFHFTYWYQGVPDYAQDLDDWPDYEYRTVCRDEMFGQVPDAVTDEDGTWTRVARYPTSGETECPYQDFDGAPIPTKEHPCPLCEADGIPTNLGESPIQFHGFIDIGDGWAEIVYRRPLPSDPDAAFSCFDVGATGE